MEKVKNIMSSNLRCCAPDTKLPEVAKLMNRYNCGFMPVTKRNNKLVGVITDRDICLYLGDAQQDLKDTDVAHLMTTYVSTCFPDDDITTALHIMRNTKMTRLPVIDKEGVLKGLLSLYDIIMCTRGYESTDNNLP